MVNAQTAPALPWGASDGDTSGAATDPASLQQAAINDPTTGSLQGPVSIALPDVGSNIEVRWQIEDEDSTESLWWKATVQSLVPASAEAAASQATAVLRYQAFRDFEEETADVVFTPNGHLYHTDSRETLLRWRREGDQQSDSDHEAYGDELVDADDLDQDQQLLERELGISAEDVMRQQLQKYPADQQRQLASGARAFVDHFREHLSQLAQAQGGNYTVTENDVHGIFSSLKHP